MMIIVTLATLAVIALIGGTRRYYLQSYIP